MISVFSYIVVITMAVLCLVPVVHTVAVSFSDQAAASAGLVTFWPVRFTLSSYQEILKDSRFFQAFGVSVCRVLLGGSINVLLIILTAYPLSKSKRLFPHKSPYLWFFLFTMLFNGGLIPTYLLVSKLKLLDTIWALVLPGAVQVFNVILLMNFFKTIPDALDESARIDGATPFVVFLKIYLPLSLPGIATITLFSIIGQWNAFFDGIIYINTAAKVPLQTYIQQLTTEVRDETLLTPEERARLNSISSLTFNAAKVFVTMVPVLLVYPFLQKYFVTGLVMGSVKE